MEVVPRPSPERKTDRFEEVVQMNYSNTNNSNANDALALLVQRSYLWVTMLASLCLSGCGITANGWNSEGVQLYKSGHFPEAIQRFQYALGTDDNNADA